jgi:hypothetical protein
MLPADDPCNGLAGPVASACRSGSPGLSDGPGGSGTDPFAALAQSIANGADWTAQQLGKVVADRTSVDVTDAGFLKQYGIVFAASAVLTLVLWLFAVARRATRGVPLTTALSEAVGLLWLAVLASAFTPLILYVLIGATSAVTDVLVAGLGSQPGGLFASLGANLKSGKVGGGPLILASVSLATIALCGALWILLVLRVFSLYVGALLGILVYSGLVSRDWWGKVRRWAGGMVALILIEPVIVIVVGLAAALQASESGGPVVTGLGVTLLALGAAVWLIWQIPGFGDTVKVARAAARTVKGAAGAVTGGASASAGVLRGIEAHSGRGSGPTNTGSGSAKPSSSVSGGISAHGSRPTDTPKAKDK